MFNKKSKNIYCLLSVFLVLLLFNSPSFAAKQDFSTPYYKLQLDDSMQQLGKHELKPDGIPVVIHAYVYGALYDDVEASLTIQVISLPSNESAHPDRSQRQFIAGTVNGLQRRDNSGSSDKFTVYNQVKSVRLHDREFKSYSYKSPEGIVEILTTIHNGKLYGFAVACYGDDVDTLNKVSHSIIEQASQIQFVN